MTVVPKVFPWVVQKAASLAGTKADPWAVWKVAMRAVLWAES